MAKRWRQVEEIRGLAQLGGGDDPVSSTFAGQTRLGLWLNQLSAFAVPLFVLLSGFCLTADREERGRASAWRLSGGIWGGYSSPMHLVGAVSGLPRPVGAAGPG